MATCSKCGDEHDLDSHIKDCDIYLLHEEHNLCFKCGFWTEKSILAKEDPRQLVMDSRRGLACFYARPDHPDALFKGFGGTPCRIRRTNGDVFTTKNLWHNGLVPEVWKASFKINAVFETQ